ncbi:MAG: hypothetical protein RR702_07100 [Clostridia bacterium]
MFKKSIKKIVVICAFICIACTSIYAEENSININISTSATCSAKITVPSTGSVSNILDAVKKVYGISQIDACIYSGSNILPNQKLEDLGIKDEANVHINTDQIKHKYNEGEITTLPSCIAKGIKTYKCTVCKNSIAEEVLPLGHALGEEKIIQPTCIAKGKKTRKCIRCEHEEVHILPALGHRYSTWTIAKEPTCNVEGLMVRKCVRCSKTIESKIAKLEHEIVEERIEPSCDKIRIYNKEMRLSRLRLRSKQDRDSCNRP